VFRGIVIDLRAEEENASDSIRRSRESFSNEIDESDSQFEKHDEQIISAFRGTVINVICWRCKQPGPMRATRRIAGREGKMANDGTIITHLHDNPTTVTDSADAQTVKSATTMLALDILMSN
jgi:hypothetical protein